MTEDLDKFQSIKILSPTSDMTVRVGENLAVDYLIQQRIINKKVTVEVTSLKLFLHKRTDTTVTDQVGLIHNAEAVEAKMDEEAPVHVDWPVPEDTEPGSYAVVFKEEYKNRRGFLFMAKETVNVNLIQ